MQIYNLDPKKHTGTSEMFIVMDIKLLFQHWGLLSFGHFASVMMSTVVLSEL